MKASTGYRAKILSVTGGSAQQVLNGGVLKLYSGVEPDTADLAIDVSNNLLVSIYKDNDGVTGLSFDDEPTVVTSVTPHIVHVPIKPTETWEGTIASSGIASFYRWEMAGDDQSQSITQVRLQGSVGNVGADLLLTNTTLAAGASQKIDHFFLSLPTL